MGVPRKQLLAYIAIGVVAVAIGVRYMLAHQSGDAAQAGMVVTLPSAGPSAGTPGAESSSSPAAELVVDVTGAVARPGVYRLPAGSRICDAIDQAGGATAKAEVGSVNLAAKLVDGQQVVVPQRGPAATNAGVTPTGVNATSTSGLPPSGPINLNTATIEQLDALSGVGPSTAQKIIAYRDANGGFKSVEELKNVSGIGDAKFAALKDLVTI